MQGQLQDIDLSILLQQIAEEQLTGELWVETPGMVGWQSSSASQTNRQALHRPVSESWLLIFFQGTLLHGSRVSDSANRLQDSLKRLSVELPSAEAVNRSSTQQHGPEYELLWCLLEQRRISPEQAGAIVRQLSEETLFELANLSNGYFRFVPGVHCPPHIVQIPINGLLSRLERKRLQWQKLYPIIHGLQQCPVLLNSDAVAPHMPSPALNALRRWANGQTSLLRIARHLNRHPVSIAWAIYPYIQAGFVKLFTTSTAQINDSPSETIEIACVDHDADRLDLLNKHLFLEGYQAQSYTSGFAALPVIAQTPPDLIFCNLDLPDLPGDQLCAMWRQLTMLRQTPIILTLDKADFYSCARARAAQATDCLQQPFTGDELVMLLEKYIRAIPSPGPVVPEVWQSDALQGKLGHDSGEAKFTSTS